MKTFLAQNQFGAPVPCADDTAGSSPAPLRGPAVPLSVSMAEPSGAMETEAATIEETAASDIIPTGPFVPPGPKLPADAELGTVSAGLSEADEALYWQLRHADNPFERDLPDVPDAHAFFNSIIETDVWADESPLFLKRLA